MVLALLSQVKVWYPMVMLGLGICHQMVAQWVVYFYAPPAGTGAPIYLEVGLVSAAMVFGRIIDAFSDPVVAYFSDRASFKSGRRKPFIFWGALLLALSFVLIWKPPVESVSFVNFFWVALMLGFFFLSYSIIAVPYLALMPEITFNEEQRITMATSQVAFYGTGAGLGFILSTTLGPLIGLPALAFVLVPLFLFALLWPVLQLQENPVQKQQGQHSGFAGWSEAVRSLLDNRTFMCWLAMQAFLWSSFIMIVMLVPYIGSVLLGVGSIMDISIIAALLLVLGSAVSVVLVFQYVRNKGKDVFYGTALLLAGGFIALFSLVGHNVLPGSAQIQAALLLAFTAGPLALVVVLPNAVVAEISEIRRQATGEHREALLYAGQGIVVKLSMAAGSAVFGFLIFSVEQTAGLETGIRLICLAAGLLFIMAAAVYQSFLKAKRAG